MSSFLFVIPEERFYKKSHYFFTDYLSRFFKLDYLIVLKDFEKEFLNTSFNSPKYDGIIFWGEIFNTKLVQNIENKNIIFVPMMDWVHPKKLSWWYRIRGAKIVCFTKFLHEQLLKHGFDTLHLQYYEGVKPSSNEKELHSKRLNVFVNNPISLKTSSILDKLFKHISYKIQSEVKNNTHVFLSLNKFEGVENDMIKALSYGAVLIGNNTPGISDYVQNNDNGYLYRMQLPLSIDFSNFLTLRENSIKKTQVGAFKWRAERKQLIDFLLKK